ncbi:APC-basic domain containing protein [Pyrenophora tritici-repentis]|uniref:APC-basic domain containing protein n=2 Tax=Pyrenophora tritici-repentis TaxID=45151 RepID=A0A2W1D5P5_9PLEO|nr:uncharacterized protein PTRG_07964 [Pyrenophora tritici-repentis Pt-1C-BFP]KAA8616691.1 APC-basic domain-containing protein [Pyrenophora tritici-repentis]EDU50883.1 predicted protein [Pyrenophora tritici-repentis Pt-1C-BFP]KAF7445986.1 APC-basic domain containing protein [Pyrenophora tritici-repentis]KAF7567083.1 APC-basic domain containing protein [Pyrenophora tritici-repentis]KAG9381693.1 APC-basic domain containing protein [Pyrenophora tritici-repentis]
MAQRQMCPSMGALRRILAADASAVSNCSTRGLHSSAKRLEEQPSNTPPAAPVPVTRKTRSATALRQITNLQNRKAIPGAGALARGSFPSGQMARRTSPSVEPGFIPDGEGAPQNAQSGAANTPRFARNPAGPRITRVSVPPPPQGQMVRAPAALRIGNAARGPMVRGPNLRGRDASKPGGPGGKRKAGGAGNNRGEGGPKRRERTSGGDSSIGTTIAETDLGTTISDKMSQQLLRLQRKEWDRVPYEPKYAKDSFAANELIHAGRELFKGEVPPIKIWGPLEKQIGVVGMFGAEAHLKVRRVTEDHWRWGHTGDGPTPEQEVPEAIKAKWEWKKEKVASPRVKAA